MKNFLKKIHLPFAAVCFGLIMYWATTHFYRHGRLSFGLSLASFYWYLCIISAVQKRKILEGTSYRFWRIAGLFFIQMITVYVALNLWEKVNIITPIGHIWRISVIAALAIAIAATVFLLNFLFGRRSSASFHKT